MLMMEGMLLTWYSVFLGIDGLPGIYCRVFVLFDTI